jgi:hypothetical protein
MVFLKKNVKEFEDKLVDAPTFGELDVIWDKLNQRWVIGVRK